MSTLTATPASARTMPGTFRLRRHADYGRVYKASRKHFSASMTYFFRLRDANEEPVQGPRVGLTVGRVMGKAVHRNRIKRRMREAVRLHVQLLSLVAPGSAQEALPIDVVLHPRKSVATMEFAALERELAKVFRLVATLAVKPAKETKP